ncbi:MAG: DUF1634 domain-containing protein [Nitrososphaerota archaeon]|nr:DUF1634 domain-containing protein [Nitrososphaerota archaeon]
MSLERAISLTLRTGVVASAILVLIGLSLYYAEGTPVMPPTSSLSAFAVFSGLLALKPESVILLGVIVLIATPVVRVLELFIDYLWSRDRIYAVLSALVLTVMLVGITILPHFH